MGLGIKAQAAHGTYVDVGRCTGSFRLQSWCGVQSCCVSVQSCRGVKLTQPLTCGAPDQLAAERERVLDLEQVRI
jgi:hypothetical protein